MLKIEKKINEELFKQLYKMSCHYHVHKMFAKIKYEFMLQKISRSNQIAEMSNIKLSLTAYTKITINLSMHLLIVL